MIQDERRMKRRNEQQRRTQLKRQGHGRGNVLGHAKRQDPNTLADKAMAKLRPSAIDALMTCYRAGRIHVDAVDEADLKALRKAYLWRRWEDPETCERSRAWYELSPSGRWAAARRDVTS